MAKEVVFYDGGCANCQQVAAFLSKHGVDYVRKNVKAHPELQAELTAKHINTLPTVIVDGQPIPGWDETTLRQILGV